MQLKFVKYQKYTKIIHLTHILHLQSPSGLVELKCGFSQNQKVPGSNLTRCSAGLRDPTLLQSSW